MQLPSRKHGLQHVSRIQGSVRLSGSHNGMKLVDEQDYLAVAVFYILKNRLQTLLKLAPVLGTRHQRTHIQCEYLLILKPLGHIPLDNTLSKAFHHRSLAHTGLSDENRVVLCLSGENPDDVADLTVPSDHGIQLLIPCLLYQLLPVLVQGIVGCLRVVRGHSLIASHRGEGLQKPLPGNSKLPEQLLDGPVGIPDHGKEEMLHGNILVRKGLGLLLRRDKHLVQILSHVNLSALYLCPLI